MHTIVDNSNDSYAETAYRRSSRTTLHIQVESTQVYYYTRDRGKNTVFTFRSVINDDAIIDDDDIVVSQLN